MFRCTDCYKEYQTHPGYCECGNDQFEEIIDSNIPNQQYVEPAYTEDGYTDDGAYAEDDGYAVEEYEEEYVPVPKLKRTKKSDKHEKKALTMMDKVGIVIFAICIILSILAFIFIGAGQKPSSNTDPNGKPLRVKNYSIPTSIDAIWDSTPPAAAPTAAKVDPSKILNTHLGSIDTEMNNYLISLAQEMINSWDREGITGNGVTQMEFMIKKDGTLVGKKIYKFSGNKSLDNSIGLLINNFGQFQTPPSSYNQDIIIISFTSNNGSLRANYPNMSK